MTYEPQTCPHCPRGSAVTVESVEAEVGHMVWHHPDIVQNRLEMAGVKDHYHFDPPDGIEVRAARLRGALLAAGLRADVVDSIEEGHPPPRFERERRVN